MISSKTPIASARWGSWRDGFDRRTSRLGEFPPRVSIPDYLPRPGSAARAPRLAAFPALRGVSGLLKASPPVSATPIGPFDSALTMCEVCDDPKLGEERREQLEAVDPDTLGPDDDAWHCEFRAEEAPDDTPLCGAPAAWCIQFNYVENHLCDPHRQKVSEGIENGLREVLQAAGFSPDEAVVAIKGRARCEWTPDEPPFTARECGRPARWAHIVAGQMFFCGEHTRAYDKEKEQLRQKGAAKKARPDRAS